MPTASISTAAIGKFREETGFGRKRNEIRPVDAVLIVAQRKFETKKHAELAARAGCDVRTCELWTERGGDISGRAFANLICSDIGFDILAELMRGRRQSPAWFQRAKAMQRLADIERQQEEQEQEIRELRRSLAG